MKEKTKEFLKKNLIGFILGLISACTISVIAATYFPSVDVTYDNTESGLASTNVQGAIDELYGVCTAEPPAGETIIEDAGLEKDPYECRYFFTGATPNNYITFNDEPAGWRIISIECDGTIKIMKTVNINTSNNLYWDSSDSNNWSRPASLNTYLNTTYYNTLNETAKKQIIQSNFSIGKITENNNDLISQINAENKTIWNDNIALITVSEYLRSNSNDACLSLKTNNENYSTCHITNWMSNLSGLVLTVTASANSTKNYIFYINCTSDGGSGFISQMPPSMSTFYTVNPTLYLSSDIKITRGTGTQTDPYEIEL